MQDAITIKYSPVYRHLHLRSPVPSSSEPPVYCLHARIRLHFPATCARDHHHHTALTATIALSSPPGPAHSPLPTLLSLNSPRIPLTRPRPPAPRSSGPFRHQILHSTPGLPLKPPRFRLSCVYNVLALCFCGIVSRRLVLRTVQSCMRGERSRASPHYLPASKSSRILLNIRVVNSQPRSISIRKLATYPL